jgi:Mg/Co/Ni transporter MgtE
VYGYQAGKADWFAAGWPREGNEARVPRAGDVARRDVPTCRPDERVGEVRDRARPSGVCVVVNEQRVVLGILRAEALGRDPATPVDQVMAQPVTVRPDLVAGEMPDYLGKKRVSEALVTTSDGVLVGLIRSSEVASR